MEWGSSMAIDPEQDKKDTAGRPDEEPTRPYGEFDHPAPPLQPTSPPVPGSLPPQKERRRFFRRRGVDPARPSKMVNEPEIED